MKMLSALIAPTLLVCAIAAAQTATPPPTTPPQPSGSMSSQDDTTHQMTHSGDSSSMSMSDKQAAMKSCMADQRKSNPSISHADAKAACKSQAMKGQQ